MHVLRKGLQDRWQAGPSRTHARRSVGRSRSPSRDAAAPRPQLVVVESGRWPLLIGPHEGSQKTDFCHDAIQPDKLGGGRWVSWGGDRLCPQAQNSLGVTPGWPWGLHVCFETDLLKNNVLLFLRHPVGHNGPVPHACHTSIYIPNATTVYNARPNNDQLSLGCSMVYLLLLRVKTA